MAKNPIGQFQGKPFLFLLEMALVLPVCLKSLCTWISVWFATCGDQPVSPITTDEVKEFMPTDRNGGFHFTPDRQARQTLDFLRKECTRPGRDQPEWPGLLTFYRAFLTLNKTGVTRETILRFSIVSIKTLEKLENIFRCFVLHFLLSFNRWLSLC